VHPLTIFRRKGGFWHTAGLLFYIFSFFQLHAAGGEYLIEVLDTEKGLPDNFVTALVQSPGGYLWVGTRNGLARFDGVRFVTFKPEDTPQLGHARIVKLFLDALGTVWINTYDGSLTSWRNGLFTKEWDGAKKNVSEVWLVASNSREIIFSFRAGLLIRRPATGSFNDWQSLKPPGNPPGAFYCQDHAGSLWCSTYDGNLWRIADGRFELVPQDAGRRGQEIHWLAPDLSGRIWVGTEREISVWDGEHFQPMAPVGEADLNVAFLSFTADGGVLVAADGRLRKCLNRKWVAELKAWPDLMQEQQLQSTLYEDREGGLWRTSAGLGVFHLNAHGVLEQIAVSHGLPGDHTTCWLKDQEGNVWVGLGNGGLARLRPKHFEVIGASEGRLARPVTSVCEDRTGALWIGTYGGGLDRLQKGTLTHFSIPTPTWADFVFSAYPDAQGQLWISAGLEDAYIFRNGELRKAPTAVHGIKSILVDRQGRTWLGRKDGVDCWADGKLREWSSHTGSIAKPVRVLAEDKQGVIWMGADDGNIYRFDGGEPRHFSLPEFRAEQAVWSLSTDEDGTLWIGTSGGGLLHFQAGHFTRFTSKAGLPDDMICQILDDQRGNLWIGTHHGICRVSKASLEAFASGKNPTVSCSVYDRSDGLPTLQCSGMYQPAAWRGQDGKLWFATEKGVVGVQPGEVPVNLRPPPVVIEEFLVDGKIQGRPEGTNANADALSVPPGKQNFEFHYTALSLTDAGKVQFRYKLEGSDSDWINAATRRWAQYNYLNPGTYCFRVVASNNDGLWNETGASITVQVLPHAWETWWFRTLLGLALVAGVASVARYVSHRGLRRELEQLEHQRDIEQDRARIARDIHDHIGSGLTRINVLNELLLGESSVELPHRVGQITGVTCELMRAMDEIVWAVNPKNDTLDSLASYLCDFTEEYLRTAGIRLRINIPTPLPAWHLTSETRHNLFLAVKEILNNIVKHSHASEVSLTLKPDVGAARIEIRDNGRGFQSDLFLNPPNGPSHTHGNGLNNLQNRAHAVGGQCLIQSEPGQGTRIELTFPSRN
jgi:ligand-binding sensor domain-containing protein/signal transduction histidine kinase